jgi:hypothetical protein
MVVRFHHWLFPYDFGLQASAASHRDFSPTTTLVRLVTLVSERVHTRSRFKLAVLNYPVVFGFNLELFCFLQICWNFGVEVASNSLLVVNCTY